jgi:hypothetical protein
VTTNEESKDLTRMKFDQLMGSLQPHKARVSRGADPPSEEQALQDAGGNVGYISSDRTGFSSPGGRG